MKRIASWLSEIEECEGRELDECAEQICSDAISWVQGSIQEWGDYPEPDEDLPITTTLLIKGDLRRNGILLSVAGDEEVRRLHSMLLMYVRDSLMRTKRDPALRYPLRVSILSNDDTKILEVKY